MSEIANGSEQGRRSRRDRGGRSSAGVGRDDGPALARVGPRLGAAAVAGDVPAPARSGSPPCSWAAASTRPLVGQGLRAPAMELGQMPGAAGRRCRAKINVVNGLFNKHATGVGIHPGQTGNILSGAALQKGAELKGGLSIDQVLARHLGEDDRPAEHGPGLRAADHRLPRDQLLDGVQLAHLLAERDLAGADGGLPLAGLRQPLRQPGQPAEPEHPRPRPRARPRA